MAKDRSADRHAKPHHSVRFEPPELWDQLGAEVGDRQRSETISGLVRDFLARRRARAQQAETSTKSRKKS